MKFERNWMINDLECSQEQTDRWQTKPIFKHGPEFDKSKYYVYIADFIGLPYFSGFSSGLKSHVLIWIPQPIEICSVTTRPSSHVLEASIKTTKEILFCKQTGLYILHTKWGLVVRGHLEPLCMFILTPKTNFMFFKQHLWLSTGWRHYWVRHSTGVTDWVCVYVNISPFEEWLKNSSKTLLAMWYRAIKSI